MFDGRFLEPVAPQKLIVRGPSASYLSERSAVTRRLTK